jgi:hypothetical protein
MNTVRYSSDHHGAVSMRHRGLDSRRSFDHAVYIARSAPWKGTRNFIIPSVADAYWFSCVASDQEDAYEYMLRHSAR